MRKRAAIMRFVFLAAFIALYALGAALTDEDILRLTPAGVGTAPPPPLLTTIALACEAREGWVRKRPRGQGFRADPGTLAV